MPDNPQTGLTQNDVQDLGGFSGGQSDPLDAVKQSLVQRYQSLQPKPSDGGQVRSLLQNFFSGAGNAMMKHVGLPTQQEQQEKVLSDLGAVTNAQGMADYHKAVASQYEMVDIGDGIQVPAKSAAQVMAARIRGQATEDTAAHRTITVPGVGAFAWDGDKYSPIGGAQIPQHQLSPGEAKAFGFPAGTTQIPESVYSQAQRLQPMTRTGMSWKETSPGVWQPLPTTSTRSYGKGDIARAAGVGGGATGGGGTGGGAGTGGKIYGGGSIYAYDPKSNMTRLTTPQEAQANGYTNPRKVTGKEIQDDTTLNNRLTDVATKVKVYEQSMNHPITALDRAKMSDLLADDKLQLGAFGLHVPTDWMSQLTKAMSTAGLSDAAKQRMINYMNVRESMMGYTRVLSGSSRGSDKNLELNLQVMPSPIMPEDYVREGVGQFKQNLDIVSQGMPKLPGVTHAQEVLHPAPSIQFKEGNDIYNIPADKLERFKKQHPQAVLNAR